MYSDDMRPPDRLRRNMLSASGLQVIFMIGALALTAVGAYIAGYTSAQPAVSESEKGVFDEAWAIIRDEFYYPLPAEEVRIYGAIRGVIETLEDPHTLLLPPVEAARDTQVMQGQVGGVGALLVMNEENQLVVVETRRGWPAEQAGVRSGDIVLEVNGESIVGLAIEVAVDRIRGPLGTDVVLRLQRPGQRAPFDITLTRTQINVFGLMLEENVAYISMSLFSATAPDDIRTQLERLLPENPRALILDLRGNGGGYLNDAIEIADLFLPDGVVATERDVDGNTQMYRSDDGDIGESVPLIVLVDGGSASASEIVAGAIQDRDRGVLVGTRTFGKGSVQTLYTLSNESQLRITRGAWYTPNETPIQRRGDEPGGLLPDVALDPQSHYASTDPGLETAIRYILQRDTF